MEDRYFDIYKQSRSQSEQPQTDAPATDAAKADSAPAPGGEGGYPGVPASAEQTSAEQTSDEQTSAEQTSVEQTSAEQTSAEQTSAEQMPAGQTSAEQMPVGQTFAGSRCSATCAPATSGKKGWIAPVLALTLLLSGLFGGVCGYLAGSGNVIVSAAGGTGLPAGAIVDHYTAILENSAANQQSALTVAAQVAYDSVVIIDVYAGEEYERAGQPSGSGSGVIWTADGYIVTCNHVIDGAALVKVTLTDGRGYLAQVVGKDARTDLAVLKINATDSTLYPVVQRDDEKSPLILAETVLAIGNPLGVLGGTATDGILSALERNIVVEGQSMTLLQTSASVNSGNSGGGLFDINGSLIGIVNAKSTGENVEGLGFAIPIGTVRTVATELITNGYVTGRPQIGIQVVSVTAANSSVIFGADYYPELRSYATKSTLPGGRDSVVYGAYLIDAGAVKYAEGSERLQFGDRITDVGTRQITESSDILAALNDYTAGETISVTVVRNQTQTVTVQIVLGQAGAGD